MYRSKFFLAVAILTLLILIAAAALQALEMQAFEMF